MPARVGYVAGMINTGFGGQIRFNIRPGGHLELVPAENKAGRSDEFLLEDAHNILSSVRWCASEMARLDNLQPESRPLKPGVIEGWFHPSRVKEYQAELAEYERHLHLVDKDPAKGQVEIDRPQGFTQSKGRLAYDVGEVGNYVGIRPNELEWHREEDILSWSYMGKEEFHTSHDIKLVRNGNIDVITATQQDHKIGKRSITIDWDNRTATLVGTTEERPGRDDVCRA